MPPSGRIILSAAMMALSVPVPVTVARAADRLAGPIAAEVLDVVDGDTLTVRVPVWLDQEVVARVRVEGIDTPERRGDCPEEREMAERALAFTRAFVSSGTVHLRDVRHDKYGGRVRARVATPDGSDLAEALAGAGLGRAYRGKAREPWCAGAAGG